MKKKTKNNNKNLMPIIKQVKKQNSDFFEVPKEYRNNPSIVKLQRELGIRISGKRGYDIIRDTFFVEENVRSNDSQSGMKLYISCFPDFVSYYNFLNGDIYKNSCYYQYDFSDEEIKKYNIDLKRINSTAFINYTASSFYNELDSEYIQQYQKLEQEKELRKKWICKVNSCNTFKDLIKIIQEFKAENSSKMSRDDLEFYFFNFIAYDKEKASAIIMQCLAYDWEIIDAQTLCSIYPPQKVLAVYNPKIESRKKTLRKYIKQLENNEISFRERSYFDERTHFFCHVINGVSKYFETFEQLAEDLHNDLSNCNLSKALLPCVDFSKYITNDKTKLPISYEQTNQFNLKFSLTKLYDRNSDSFVVNQTWVDGKGQPIKKHTHNFSFFADFVFFLENDLSDADLLFCDGLKNLHNLSDIIFTNADLRSEMLDKLGISYSLRAVDIAKIKEFPVTVENEAETVHELTYSRDIYDMGGQKVYYISDLHLLHRFQNNSCKSVNDIIYILQPIIDNLLSDIKGSEKSTFGKMNILLIGGDTSSNFDIFKIFVRLLKFSIYQWGLNLQTVFVLGNHDLWGLPNYSFNEIIEEYRKELREQGMYLLHNNIIYSNDNSFGFLTNEITTNELLSVDKKVLKERLKTARIVMFGGLAFSGYNKEFNADNGIYKAVINRKQEIAETKMFEQLYNTVCDVLSDRCVIVLTHTPPTDWCRSFTPQPGFVYVSGHTHKNSFHDDGEQRIYADNQIGYKNKQPHLKFFCIKNDYDLFSEYGDGIYEISRGDYILFYKGKTDKSTRFTRKYDVLYMLKKNGFYCFILSDNGKLYILYGGNIKRLNFTNINYYYDNMDRVIAYINQPLSQYAAIQKEIANEVRRIGGYGKIHGAIIDIDYNNHIYVNPFDSTITGYWASYIVNKKVFPSVPHLLQTNCPEFYENYKKLLDKKTTNILLQNANNNFKPNDSSVVWLNTDIYKTSLKIKEMQNLEFNILSQWIEPTQKLLE